MLCFLCCCLPKLTGPSKFCSPWHREGTQPKTSAGQTHHSSEEEGQRPWRGEGEGKPKIQSGGGKTGMKKWMRRWSGWARWRISANDHLYRAVMNPWDQVMLNYEWSEWDASLNCDIQTAAERGTLPGFYYKLWSSSSDRIIVSTESLGPRCVCWICNSSPYLPSQFIDLK